jgi:hypothetical protein
MYSPQLLGRDEQRKWLAEDIPYRIRAALPGIPMKTPWAVAMRPVVLQLDTFANHCVWAALHEGRLTALRWLIEFVGIKESKGVAAEWTPTRQTDVRIDSIHGGVVFTPSRPDALKLAMVWQGCSQASGHATEGTNHPDVSDQSLADALAIIIAHLEVTIYATNQMNLFGIVRRE